MMDNELRDIILEKNDEQKSLKIKKLLMIIAAFSILFLMILIVMKIINSEDSDQVAQDMNTRLVLPPEPVNIKDTKTQGNDDLFQQVPILPENKGQDSFEDMVKTLKDKEVKRQQDQEVVLKSEANDTASQPRIAKIEPKSSNTQTQQSQSIESKSIVKPKEESKSKIAPNSTQPAKTKGEKQEGQVQGLASGSYIQIVAVRNFSENAAEIRKLRANGYVYKLYKATVNGVEMTKVLVGPYSGNELKSELAKVKKDISSGAFIINIK